MRSTEDRRLVTVCDECLQASCWHGEFYCQDAQSAGTLRLPVWLLRELAQEHESYWDVARIAKIEGTA